MIKFSSTGHTARISSLAIPIVIGQLASIANPVLDTMMVARVSAIDLGALSVGASIYVSLYVGLNGVMQSLTPTFGQMYGAGRFKEMGQEAKQGVWLALFLALIGLLILSFPEPLLRIAKASPELTEKASLYLRILAFSLPASLCFLVYNTLNNAMARPKMVMAIQLCSLVLKVPLNMLFIFGGFGIPAFGGPGCAIVTLILTWLGVTIGWLILYYNPFYRMLHLFDTGFAWPQWSSLKSLLKLGLPMGLNFFIEVTAFTFMALFIARLGTSVVAGHQIAANFSTVLYMLPFSIASATAILVAQSIGAHDLARAKQISVSGLLLGGILSFITGFTVWLMSGYIVRIYTPFESVAATALPLLFFVSCYQFFDYLQAISSHILRAYKVVLTPTILYVLAFWCVGLGGGYILGLDPFDLHPPAFISGASGFWFSNSIGLACSACGMLWLLRHTQKKFALSENRP